MKKVSFVVESYLHENKLFNKEETAISRDNLSLSYIILKEEFEKYGYDLSTNDINTPSQSDVVIYRDLPKYSVLPEAKDQYKTFLILSENDIIIKNNWVLKNHENFKKIFTWDDRFVDNKKYFKLNYAFDIPTTIPKDLSKKTKLCTLIAGNKSKVHPLELYSKREEAIKWFEKNHPEDFDFYGFGWDIKVFHNSKILKELGRVKFIQKLLKPTFKTYRGSVDEKFSTLQKYKFSICYENAKDYSGYITEKLFDSFFAGCVPIYWGADNIFDYVPKDCFIDKRDFKTYKELYKHIKNMDDETYLGYLNNIENFFNSKQAEQFKISRYIETIIKQTLEVEELK